MTTPLYLSCITQHNMLSWNLDKIPPDKKVVKWWASLCPGPWLYRGTNVWGWQIDGGTFVPLPCNHDGNYCLSPHHCICPVSHQLVGWLVFNTGFYSVVCVLYSTTSCDALLGHTEGLFVWLFAVFQQISVVSPLMSVLYLFLLFFLKSIQLKK